MEFLILIAVFGLMMWMMSRGAKKQRQAAQDLRSSLEPGQQVMTASGFYGTIVDIDGDVITIESSPGIETMWKRDAVSAVTAPPFAVEEDLDEETSDDVAELAVPDDASSLTGTTDTTVVTDTTDTPVVTDTTVVEEPERPAGEQPDRPGDEPDDRRA